MFLTPEELEQLTGKRRRDAQIRALRYMGVEHKVRPDGSVAVLRAHVEKLLDGDLASAIRGSEVEPDWDSLNA